MRLFLKILPFVFSVLIAHVKEAHARFSYALQENKFELSLELEAKELQEEKEEIKSILPKLASHFSSKAAVSIIGESGATVIERFAEAGADDIAFSVMAKYEVLVTPATKGFLAQSILAQGMKQGLNYADDAAKTGGKAFKDSFKYADRVRMRAVQDPVSHNFPYSFDNTTRSAFRQLQF